MEQETEEQLEQLPSLLGNQVSVKNIVTRAAQSLGIVEKRIVFAAISQIDSRKPLKHYWNPDKRTVRVTAVEYAALSKTDIKVAYQELKRAAERLFERYLHYKIPTPRGENEVFFRWVESAEYQHGEGWIEVTLSTKILPFITELSQRFTRYRLEQACGLRSVYSWRLLEYLTSWKEPGAGEKGARTVELEKFRDFMEVPASYKWGNIRQKVIEPAIAELAEKDGWEIQWRGVKTGRKFTAITFVWERSAQRDLFREAGN
jgi:plasmid replication initiation protein